MQLRNQRQVVEETVDDIVQGYHSGFNKAIHNYSQILRLFSDSKSQVKVLHRHLAFAQHGFNRNHTDCTSHLGAHSCGVSCIPCILNAHHVCGHINLLLQCRLC